MSDESTDIGSWFPVPVEHELPEDAQKMFAKVRDNLGFVPNVFRSYSYRPDRRSEEHTSELQSLS